ncbi:MAG: AfsR/SARP family transcriptional regulator, partial [bacterium]
MDHSVRIQMMGNYLIFIDEQRTENPLIRSRKGSALLAFLILHRGYQVPNQRLLRELWSDNIVSNPENALKTLVSRTRNMLNQMADGLGACLVSDRGAYHWEQQEGIRVDALELMDLFDAIERTKDTEEKREMYKRILSLYKGDLYQTGSLEEEAAYAQRLHRQYLEAMYDYIDLLRREEAYNEISAVCRTALEVDNFDDHLHIELMKAMVHLNRVSDAMAQYRHAANITYRFLGAEPSENMREFYAQLNRNRKSLKFNLDAIRNELRQSSNERGAFVCDYNMFK